MSWRLTIFLLTLGLSTLQSKNLFCSYFYKTYESSLSSSNNSYKIHGILRNVNLLQAINIHIGLHTNMLQLNISTKFIHREQLQLNSKCLHNCFSALIKLSRDFNNVAQIVLFLPLAGKHCHITPPRRMVDTSRAEH